MASAPWHPITRSRVLLFTGPASYQRGGRGKPVTEKKGYLDSKNKTPFPYGGGKNLNDTREEKVSVGTVTMLCSIKGIPYSKFVLN